MKKRYAAIWFPHLVTDWFANRKPELKTKPFVLTAASHGKMTVMAANAIAQQKGVAAGMSLADARAFIPSIEACDDKPDLPAKLLRKLAEWCIRFTPICGVDMPDGVLLDISGCAHLWKGETSYLQDIKARLVRLGYTTSIGIADTLGAAWAISRFGNGAATIPPGRHATALLQFPPAALRLEPPVVERLHKLGLSTIGSFMGMQRSALRRRFGLHTLLRLDAAMGNMDELIEPVQPVSPYYERLPCLEPIVSRSGIEHAIEVLLSTLCLRLKKEGNGLRMALLKSFRVDGNMQQISISTHNASNSVKHLFKLFELHIDKIEPALGIELFVLEASKVQEAAVPQTAMWKSSGSIEDSEVSELLDRIKGKFSNIIISRFVPDQHYWPERSYRATQSLDEKAAIEWRMDKQRPIHVLPQPQPLRVTAPIPDYPPMNFTYNGTLHKVVKADGPERIEREWWLDGAGLHRDYYSVEDESGKRYWLFRLGHYDERRMPEWFIHGFFA